MTQRGIQIVRNFVALRIEDHAVIAEDGRALSADCVFWATAAQAHRWPRASALLTDDAGFVKINRALRSISHPNVFAVGDCASWHKPLPKAGVYAVRMGPVLAHNLRAAIAGKDLLSYRPQRRFLTLIGTGDENAVASWGVFGVEGKWVWRWKQSIDQRFLAAHQ
jgi:NADH dehydrogenase FAD-containing subunit